MYLLWEVSRLPPYHPRYIRTPSCMPSHPYNRQIPTLVRPCHRCSGRLQAPCPYPFLRCPSLSRRLRDMGRFLVFSPSNFIWFSLPGVKEPVSETLSYYLPISSIIDAFGLSVAIISIISFNATYIWCSSLSSFQTPYFSSIIHFFNFELFNI